MEEIYPTGAIRSPYDIRTFAFSPSITKASVTGGKRWEEKDIDNQSRVGICTAISLTMNAEKIFGVKFSADFQYLIQKKNYDNPVYPGWEWGEGSSIFHALRAGKDIGFLPYSEFEKWVTEEDRKLPYSKYIKKLQAVPEEEIERLKLIANKYRLRGYQYVAPTRDTFANAIDESEAGILARYELGNEWYRQPIEPLRSPKVILSGHAVNETNYDGNSSRIANSWGVAWADKGTAYRLWNQYKPTEGWIPYYEKVNPELEKQLEDRKKIKGQILDLIQKVIELIAKL